MATRHAIPLLLLWLFAPPAQAQNHPGATAEALFRAGREAAEAGHHELACTRFRESYRLEAATGTLLNLAVCQRELGQLVAAWKDFRRVQDDLPAGDPRASLVSGELDALEARLARVVVRLAPGAPKEATIKYGDVSLTEGSLGVSLPVDPGPQRIVVEAPNHEPRIYDFSLGEGQAEELVVEPGAKRAPELAPPVIVEADPTPVPSDSSQPSGSKILPYGLLGLGAAGLITAGISTVVVLNQKAIVDRECPEKICASNAGVEAGDQGQRFFTLGAVALGVGVLASGLGTYLLLSGSDETETGARLLLQPELGLDSVGFTLRGTFAKIAP